MSELALRLIKENRKKKAKSLYIRNCILTKIPEKIGELVWLRVLMIDGLYEEDGFTTEYDSDLMGRTTTYQRNSIILIPESFKSLVNLRSLSITNCELNDFRFLSFFSKLEFLYLANTNFNDLSPLVGITNLKKINCSNTQVSDL